MITIAEKTFFDSFDEAANYFNLTDYYIKLIDHPDSLEKILQNGCVIQCIGVGKTLTPGRPSGNQQLHLQETFFSKASTYPYLFPVFYKKKRIEYMGSYRLKDFKKVISPAGFLYFEYTLNRQSKQYMIEYT